MKKGIFIALVVALVAPTAYCRKPFKRARFNGAQTQAGSIKPITTREEYYRLAQADKPTVIVFSSSTCSACDIMKDTLTLAAQRNPKIEFYSVSVSDDAFKGITKELDIKGYPTTHFINKGTKQVVRGSREPRDIEPIIDELLTGKENTPASDKTQAASKS